MESFNHITDKYEVARHLTVFVNLDRFVGTGAPEESSEHADVWILQRLPRTIDIEEAQDRRFEIIYRADLFGQLLLLIFRQAVDRNRIRRRRLRHQRRLRGLAALRTIDFKTGRIHLQRSPAGRPERFAAPRAIESPFAVDGA